MVFQGILRENPSIHLILKFLILQILSFGLLDRDLQLKILTFEVIELLFPFVRNGRLRNAFTSHPPFVFTINTKK